MRNEVFKHMTRLMISATLMLNSVSVLPIYAIEYTLNREEEETYEEIISEDQIQEDQSSDEENEEVVSLTNSTQKNDEMGAVDVSVSVSDFQELVMAIYNAGDIPTTIIITGEIVFTSSLTINNNQEIKLRASDLENSGLLIKAENTGGRVRIENGTFIMNGGEINNNGAGLLGGGIRITDDSDFIMNGGDIINNSILGTNGIGGGVSIENSTFEMNDGLIKSNQASVGGGVLAGADTKSTMYGGRISENVAGNGGGVSIETNGSFTMHAGTINGNQANNNGGGIHHTANGAIHIHGGSIVNNKASLIAGGIYAGDLDHLMTNESVWFEGNTSSIATKFTGDPNDYPNIQFAKASTFDHILNNYDIKYPIEEALWF